MAHGLSCSVARGILPDQGSNLCQYLGRQILCHSATREAPQISFLKTDEKELFKQDLVVVWNRDSPKFPGKFRKPRKSQGWVSLSISASPRSITQPLPLYFSLSLSISVSFCPLLSTSQFPCPLFYRAQTLPPFNISFSVILKISLISEPPFPFSSMTTLLSLSVSQFLVPMKAVCMAHLFFW